MCVFLFANTKHLYLATLARMWINCEQIAAWMMDLLSVWWFYPDTAHS